MKQNRANRIPVSTKRTGCTPFNIKQKSAQGYKIGENPVKSNGEFEASYASALDKMRNMDCAGWRNYGAGNSQSAHKAIGWVLESDAQRLLKEKDDEKRVELFMSLTDVVY
ncbi:hypothetical protein [Vibrio gigantis]|uniref:Uncharacterized protein n=1 Tax=Vibrio gigantis TaxID=296199 RepID=A0A5M9P6B4_9VIBR|nr:hypothetical protein [Vibrio gigantis]KAA8681274.1 hypothetical protein F4W18_01630 [Vibrio gigantis]